MRLPTWELFVHEQGELSPAEVSWLEERLGLVLTEIVAAHPESELAALDELEYSLVDDATLAEIHGTFCDDPTPTDVITFPHGEILVSVEMAAQRAEEYGKGLCGETFLYLIHGLLHLVGFDDHRPEDAEVMAAEQERLWEKFAQSQSQAEPQMPIRPKA